jgi:hypothetical protein
LDDCGRSLMLIYINKKSIARKVREKAIFGKLGFP